jgi:hypothetical protein
VVKHSEYVQDIFGSPGYSISKLRVNAASLTTFPWLASLAPNFEKYRFRSLRFLLKPQAPSTKPGVIMMTFDYDPTDSPPTAKAEMLQYDGAVRVNSWSGVSTSMKSVDEKFTSSILPTNTADVRLSDAANLFLAVSGQDNTDAVSELWAEYVVELITPQARLQCDSFALQRTNWEQPVAFAPGDVTNPSALFDVGGGTSEVICLKTGRYGIYSNAFRTAVMQDISLGAAVTLNFWVNGVLVSQNSHAGSTTQLPLQHAASSATFVAGVQLLAGDSIQWRIDQAGITNVTLSLSIYPLDA